MKRFRYLTVLLAMSLLAGCSQTPAQTSAPESTTTVSETSAETSASETETEPAKEEPVSLKSYFGSDKGFEGKAGVCVSEKSTYTPEVMDLVYKEYNSITCENEMKPESILGRSPKLSDETDEFGDRIPVLDFSRADSILKVIKKHNDADPDHKIAVRGHVLVWHSQTPGWFFREGYSSGGKFVSKEQMLKRMEWYIKSVMEHFDGPDAEYKGMIYAWDVVNEQIEPADYNEEKNPDRIRFCMNGEDTGYYSVFQGDISYITQAFVFANKYAPADVKLFYNDYSEDDKIKCKYICKLLEAIKSTPGARIDGMGMQGHYGSWTSVAGVETALRNYAAVVGEVQITELDMQTPEGYKGETDEETKKEFERQAQFYKELFDMLSKVDKEDGIDVSAATFWGTHDTVSWLRSTSAVGGGATGVRKQEPLLFDGDLKPKPAYYRILGLEEKE